MAIDTKYLMIGNWLLDSHGQPFQVTTLSKHPDIHDLSFANFIPISDKVLQDCGLELDGFKTYNIDISEGEIDLTIIVIDLRGGYIYVRQGMELAPRHEDDMICVWNRDLEPEFSLHQLQNLCLILGGKELIYNPLNTVSYGKRAF